LPASPNPAGSRQEFRPQVPIAAKTSPEDVAEGKRQYEANCSGCHGLDGGGGMVLSIQGLPARLGAANTALIDEYTRECLAIRVARRFGRYEVIEAPADVMLFRGIPENFRSDNGPEFVAKELRQWLAKVGTGTNLIA